MKKQQTVKPFSFKNKTHQEVVDYFNDEYPISIKHNEDLINRIYARYPLISKAEIAMIVKATFSSFRDLLILGKVLNFNKLFFNTKLHFSRYKRAGRIFPSLRVKIAMPPKMREKI